MIKVHCVQVNANVTALPLRGGAYWEALGSGMRLRHRVMGWFSPRRRREPYPEVKINSPIAVPPLCPSLLFICMPYDAKAVEVARSYREHGSHVIVDYFGDVLHVTEQDDYSPGAKAAGATVTEEARDFWSQPEVLGTLMACLMQATAITTPFPEFIPGLARLTGGTPVFHLPDLPSRKRADVFRFNRNFTAIMKALS